VFIGIIDAYYTDLDSDETLDIVSHFMILSGSLRHQTIKIYVFLILPSGFEFSYKWTIIMKESRYLGQILFYDHALESGFYKLAITTKLLTGGSVFGTIEFEFDPPGSSGGGDPLAKLM
ncbi:MAG: hypothetical protein ACFFB2_15545, partial [Promethearchaeota archaeon]